MALLHQDFLKTWTPELAWWMGTTYGDGNVFSGDGNYRTSIIGSPSTTTRWLALISSAARAPYEIKTSPGTHEAYVYSKEVVEWWQARGICGKKSHDLEWPSDLPAALYVHFLRGLWDTDGSLGIERRRAKGRVGNDAPLASYSSACEGFVHVVRERVVELVGVEPVKVVRMKKVERGKTFWQFGVKWASAPAMKIADALYGAAPPHLVNEDRLVVYAEMVAFRAGLAAARCACGGVVQKQGQCAACWYAARPPKNSLAPCACGAAAVKRGLCSACYHKDRRRQKAAQAATT